LCFWRRYPETAVGYHSANRTAGTPGTETGDSDMRTISFILAFNNLEISFYNLGAIPTLPSVAWGSLRFGLGPELFALAALTNGLVFVLFAVMYVLMRTGIVKFGYRGG